MHLRQQQTRFQQQSNLRLWKQTRLLRRWVILLYYLDAVG
jgi:hypothetical protein